MDTALGEGRLRDLVPFRDADAEELATVRDLAEVVVVDPGTVLVRRGDPTPDLQVVVEGRVRVATDHVIGDLGPGDVVGEVSALHGDRAGADVVAVEPSVVLLVRHGEVPALLELPSVARRLDAIAGARLAIRYRGVVEAASVPVVAAPPRVRGVGAGLHSSRDVPARPARTVVLLALVVAGAIASVWFVAQRNQATEVALEDLTARAAAPAADGFDLAALPPPDVTTPEPATGDAPPAAPPDVGDVSTVPSPNPAAGDPEPEAPATGTLASPDPTGEPTPSSSAPPATASGRTMAPPAPGIYTYDTTGGERISIAGASHQYPPETNAVIRTGEGCTWVFEHYVLEEHVDRQAYCTTSDELTTLRFETRVTFFGQEDGLLYVCEPPILTLDTTSPVGATNAGRCSTEDGESHADYDGELVAFGTITLDGADVELAHVVTDFEMTGESRGSSHYEVFLDRRSGLAVRILRETDLTTPSQWGDVRYQENATFDLQSTEPRQ